MGNPTKILAMVEMERQLGLTRWRFGLVKALAARRAGKTIA
jgi:hypothetical protein